MRNIIIGFIVAFCLLLGYFNLQMRNQLEHTTNRMDKAEQEAVEVSMRAEKQRILAEKSREEAEQAMRIAQEAYERLKEECEK